MEFNENIKKIVKDIQKNNKEQLESNNVWQIELNTSQNENEEEEENESD